MAADLLEQYPDGVWLMELASLADPALLPQEVASVLGLTEQAGKTFAEILTDYLKSKRLLLVLDNCEHLLNACTQLGNTLLRACPLLTILATSREGLGIAGEQTYRVPSLSLPDPNELLTVEQVSQYEAVRLFIERAVSSRPGFTVSNSIAPALASVCHRLDGIPLAIELAAARVRSLTVEEIDTRLDDRFRLLTGGNKTALPRQQTLRALIDWSYDLLNPKEKLLLARLSVFAGGWSLEAVEQVGEGETVDGATLQDWEVLDLLTSLVDKSLVMAEAQAQTTRYRLMETVRQYSRDRMVENNEERRVRARHRDYFLMLAEEIKPKLIGSEQAHWLEVLEGEHDNLRLALTFCLEDPEESEAGLHLAAALARFWQIRGHLSEGRQHLTVALSRGEGNPYQKARGDALNGAGGLAWVQGDYAAARTLYEESLAIRRELGDKESIAGSLNNLGLIAKEQGNYAVAHSLYEAALELNRELGNRSWEAINLNNLGLVAQEQGDYATARALLLQSLATRRVLEDRWGIASCLGNLGIVAQEQGDYTAARTLQEESLAIYRELGDRWDIAIALSDLGFIAKEQGDYALARALAEESLTICLELGNRKDVALCLELYAALAQQEQQPERAAHLWGAATALREAIGILRTTSLQEKHAPQIAQARSALGEATFAAAFEAGRAMTLEQAVKYVLLNDEAKEPGDD